MYLEQQFDLVLPEIVQGDEGYRSEGVLREILSYFRSVIWRDAGPPDDTNVEMVNVGLDEWRASRAGADQQRSGCGAESWLTLEVGSEFAVDAPWGLEIISVSRSGRVRYERRQRGECHRIEGHASVERIATLFSDLAGTSFPTIPPHPFPPGASVVVLHLTNSTDSVATLDYYYGLRLDGYREILTQLGGLGAALRTGDAATLESWHFVLAK